MLIPLPWLAEYVPLGGRDGAAVAAALVSVGLEEEAILEPPVSGPLVAGLVLEIQPEPQKNGKVINWCQVAVGGDSPHVRGIVCGAHNFQVGDVVVVAIPGAVLPGPFPISSRKTYGHISDGMICSEQELGLGGDSHGILVLGRMEDAAWEDLQSQLQKSRVPQELEVALVGPIPVQLDSTVLQSLIPPGGVEPTEVSVGDDLKAWLGLDQPTVEVNITPDRGYCFSLRGVAREFSHATRAKFTDPALRVAVPPPGAAGFAVELADAAPIHEHSGCDRFVTRIVRGCDAAKPAPGWMRQRLIQAGMRPISLAVDVTNYVMLELGQPLHAYDLHQVAEPIVVRRAAPGERLETLDGVDRALDPEDLLITDSPGGERGSRVLGLAGVMGGASSEVTETTRDLLVEAAHFDPVSVARTSRRHKLGSEAARRFERGVDPELQAQAAQRVVDLLVQYGGGQAEATITDVGSPAASAVVPFDPAYPEKLVGVAYPPDQVQAILEQIGCRVETGTPENSAWLVTPPSWRPDLSRAVDLVEEVARIAGYADIPSVLPAAPAGEGLTKPQRLRRSVARSLADFGLVQVLSYPFVGEDTFNALGYSPEDPRRSALKLANPLDMQAPYLRTEVLQTLLATARRNVGRGNTDLALYELGLVWERPSGELYAPILRVDARPSEDELAALEAAVPAQPRHVAGVLVGQWQTGGIWGPGRAVDWADAVEAAQVVARAVHLELTVEQAQQAPFHPGRCARLLVAGQTVGYAGELDPRILPIWDLPPGVAAFELDLDALVQAAPSLVEARPVSAWPVAKEDLALVVDQGLPVADLVAALAQGADSLLEEARVFDVYQGDQIPEDKKSVAVALRLRAADHTLSSEEIARARQEAIQAAAAAVGAELRA